MYQQSSNTVKSGYLNEDFRLFHLNSLETVPHRYHYHEFDKIIIFVSGRVTYTIEGKSYHLKPWDVLFVSHHMMHKPEIDPEVPYERYAIWVNADFLASHSGDRQELSGCFRRAERRTFNLMHPDDPSLEELQSLLVKLEKEYQSTDFGAPLLQKALFLQMMVLLNRLSLKGLSDQAPSVSYDPKLSELVTYINGHLEEPLSVSDLADRFYLSKSHLMHKFKEGTGYTLHQYILQKRLLKAKALIEKGAPVTEAAVSCGFSEYSTFLRAFKHHFRELPTVFKP